MTRPRRLLGQIQEAGHEVLADLAVERGYLKREAVDAGAKDALATLTAEQLAELREARTRRDLQSLLPGAADTAPLEVIQARNDPARLFGRYVLVEQIGRGGAGTVWKAWDERLGRWVALKVPRHAVNTGFRQRFLREARVAAGLHHPNLVAVHDAGEHQDRPFLVMELVRGEPLSTERGFRPAIEALRKVALAIEEVHRQGVIHRDLKPANILVDEKGEPRVVDFGLALVTEDETALTKTGTTMGTPLYMAPEQVKPGLGAIDARTDVYALGVILYELLVGKAPFAGESALEIYDKIVREDPVAPRRRDPRLSPDLEAICLKAMDKEPARRYADARAFADDLASFLEGLPVQARRTGRVARYVRRVRRRHVAWGLAATAALFAVILLATRKPEPSTDLLAGRLSAAYADLNSKTGAAMRDLEDRWHGGDKPVNEPLSRILLTTDQVAAQYPEIRLPEAWKGLATFYAGREEEGLAMIRSACGASTTDPFPFVLLARAHMTRFIRATDLPIEYDLNSSRLGVVEFTELPPMKTALAEATAAIDRAAAFKIWGKLQHGLQVLRYVQSADLLVRREYAKALTTLGELRQDPALQGEADLLLGLGLLVSGRTEDAVAAWDRTTARGWVNAFYYSGVGRLLVVLSRGVSPTGREDLERAIRDLDAAYVRKIKFSGLWSSRAVARLQLGGMDLREGREAGPSFERAIADTVELTEQQEPARAARIRGYVHMQIASHYMHLRMDATGSLREAIAEFDAALKVKPDAEGRMMKARACLDLGQSLLEVDGEAEPAYREAIAEIDRVLAEAPPTVTILLSRGRAHMGIGTARGRRKEDPSESYRLSLADYAAVLDLSPKYTSALLNRAALNLMMGDVRKGRGEDPRPTWQLALDDLDVAIPLDPDAKQFCNRSLVHMRMALADLERNLDPLGHFEKSIADASRATELEPADPVPFWVRGVAHHRLGHRERQMGDGDGQERFEQALKDYATAQKLRPKYWEAFRERGTLLMMLKRWDEGFRELDRSLEIHPNQPELRAKVEAERLRRKP